MVEMLHVKSVCIIHYYCYRRRGGYEETVVEYRHHDNNRSQLTASPWTFTRSMLEGCSWLDQVVLGNTHKCCCNVTTPYSLTHSTHPSSLVGVTHTYTVLGNHNSKHTQTNTDLLTPHTHTQFRIITTTTNSTHPLFTILDEFFLILKSWKPGKAACPYEDQKN